MMAGGWEARCSMGALVYWHKPITSTLRLAVRGRSWTVYERDEEQFSAWRVVGTGDAKNSAAAKRAAEAMGATHG